MHWPRILLVKIRFSNTIFLFYVNFIFLFTCWISFGNAVGAMYVREYFDESARKSANEMVKDIRDVFNEIIDELDWMDDKTRIRAKEKAAAMTTHIAYPDELLDDKKLTERHSNVCLIHE